MICQLFEKHPKSGFEKNPKYLEICPSVLSVQRSLLTIKNEQLIIHAYVLSLKASLPNDGNSKRNKQVRR